MDLKPQKFLKTKSCITFIWSFVKQCEYYCRWVHSFATTVAIVVEIADKIVDGAITFEYHKGRLFHAQKSSVFAALVTFTITGCFISLGRLYFYFCQLGHSSKVVDDTEGTNLYEERFLQMSALKIVLEAFPQSVIARFYFVDCPMEKYGWGFGLYTSFDIYCGAPFVSFYSYFLLYLRKRTQKGINEMELHAGMVCVMCVASSLASAGLVFVSLSLLDAYKRC